MERDLTNIKDNKRTLDRFSSNKTDRKMYFSVYILL